MKRAELALVTPTVVALACVWGAGLGGCAFIVPNKGAPAATQARQAAPPPPRAPYVAPNLKHTRAELEEQVAQATTGYDKKGESQGKLDPFEAIDVPVKRGLCYKLALILDEGVEFSEHAKRGISFRVKREGQLDLTSATAFGPGGVVDLGCPNDALTAHVDVIADWGSARDKSHVHDLGSGGFKTVVYSKPITAKALAERNQRIKENEEQQARESEEFHRKYEAEQAQRREEQRERDRQREQDRRDSNSCRRQCSMTLSICQSNCGNEAGCRGRCQSDEWHCKDSCR
ncbi:MAG TPA: hypothetical protein VIF57_31385 [Polyangia bacterium]|jgi:hypothetical protein